MEMIKVRPRSAWVLEAELVGLVLVLPLLPPVMQWMVEIKRERAGGREVGAKERNREREKEREKERACLVCVCVVCGCGCGCVRVNVCV